MRKISTFDSTFDKNNQFLYYRKGEINIYFWFSIYKKGILIPIMMIEQMRPGFNDEFRIEYLDKLNKINNQNIKE